MRFATSLMSACLSGLLFTGVVVAQEGGESSAMLSVPEGVDAADWAGIRAAHEASRHRVSCVDGVHRARNPGQQWDTLFDGRGFTTQPDDAEWSWGLELQGYGFEGAERTVTGIADVTFEGQRVAYEWDEVLTEWYINDSIGLEHGYTLTKRPTPASDGAELVFVLDIRGTFAAEVHADGRGVSFLNEAGVSELDYAGLTVFDADGHTLPARLDVDAGRVVFSIQERGARYPLTIDPWLQRAYIKASNTGASDFFGQAVAVSGDIAVVGAWQEDSNATGVDGNQGNNSASNAGAAYVFAREDGTWSQQAYLKAPNTEANDWFGSSVAVDGTILNPTIVVGAWGEDSPATGVGGGQGNGAGASGAAYVFVRFGSTTWSYQAYLKASNTDPGDSFGSSVAVSGDTVVVGAPGEDSFTGSQSDNTQPEAGAAYVFVRSGSIWSQQAYLKQAFPGFQDQFGASVAIDGERIVVGAPGEDSNATGVNGDQSNNTGFGSGAAYVFTRIGTVWLPEAFLKASNTGNEDMFGSAVAISGTTVAVAARDEDSSATGVDGDGSDNTAPAAGAAYVFVRDGAWSQQAYLKASNTDIEDYFGQSISVSGDTVVVGAYFEDSGAVGVNGDQGDVTFFYDGGAAYVYVRDGTDWGQQAYLKASNTGASDHFGVACAVSGDTIVVGADLEDGSSSGVGGAQGNGTSNSGAVYVFGVPWKDLGFSLAGCCGSPSLVGVGTLVGGDPMAITLSNAAPSTTAWLIVGFTRIDAFFKGGTLVPAVDLEPIPLPTGLSGYIDINANWPVGIPSEFTTYFQYWIVDGAGPVGFSASNAISGTTP